MCMTVCIQHDGLMLHVFCGFVEKSMSNILCNFVFASKDEPCNPHTQHVFLTHGTMLPVWSSDRAHAGRCLAKAAWATWKRHTFAFVDGFCRLPIFPKVQL